MAGVTLNLRVGSKMTGKAGHNERKPEELEPNLDDLTQIDSTSVDLFRPVINASTLSEQTSHVRNIFKECVAEKYQIISIVMVQWYFNLFLNSPLKRVIASCLNQVTDERLADLAIEQIASHVSTLCGEEDELSDTEDESEESVDKVKTIARCLENFKLGEMAVVSQIDAVVNFLSTKLGGLVENMCEEDVAPADKSKFADKACDTIRTLVAVFKSRTDKISETKVASVRDLCQRILQHHDLPLDLRSNAAIAYVAGLKAIEKERNSASLVDSALSEDTDVNSIEGGAGTLLAIAHGILACYDNDSLIAAQGGKPVLLQLLRLYLWVANREKETGLVMGHSRGMLSWSARYNALVKEGLTLSPETLESVLEYVWAHLEHHVDSVRHNTKDFLNNLIRACQEQGEDGDKILQNLIQQTLRLPLHKKARFSCLSCLVKSYSLERVLEFYPNIRSEMLALSCEYALVGHIVDLYENILVADHARRTDNIHLWVEESVQPLVIQFQECEETGSIQLVKNLLKRCVKLCPSVIDLLLGKAGNIKNANQQSLDEREATMDPKLAACCLRMSREMGQPWDFAKHANLIRKSFRHPSDDVRLQTLALLVESHSSIEVFSVVEELHVILDFLKVSLSLQLPSSRQVLLAMVKKLLTRMQDGAKALEKKLKQPKFLKEFDKMNADLKNYARFVLDLTKLLFSNLFQGANFARRVTVLEILGFIHQIFGLTHSSSWINFNSVLTPQTAATLFSCLADSYDENKMRALSILRELPPGLLELDRPDPVRKMLDTITALSASCKPPDSVTAGYMMKLFLTAPAAGWVLADKLSLLQSDSSQVKFLTAVYLRNRLAEQLAVAENSLLEAARDGPMYGTLFVLRFLYEELDREEMTESWADLTKDIIALGYKLWKVVSSVVASDSPEGHLPMDKDGESMKELKKTFDMSLGKLKAKSGDSTGGFNDQRKAMECLILDKVEVKEAFSDEIASDIVDHIMDISLGSSHNQTEDSMLDGDEDFNAAEDAKTEGDEAEELAYDMDNSESGLVKAKEVSSQMLLLCAWRTVKELSLLLGDLCQSYKDNSQNIVQQQQILDISAFLMELLSQTKHRGAFEQAYIAFTKVCSCMWKSTNNQLHPHPSHLLEEIIDSISGSKRISNSSKSGLCATRRSAGVPFIVQAVLTTDPDPQGIIFKRTMSRLVDLASNHDTSATNGPDTANCESRVHACNILRALYRDTRLGDAVASHVEVGVKVAVRGFEAANWAERNAATLLFSALVTRIFGVKREKDSSQLSAKNCLTGKVFFQRYPGLHEFLLKKLSDSLDCTVAGTLQLQPALYPILLILSRIFPSPSESVNNPFQLSAFIAPVRQCAASPVLAIRQLAAKALVPLLPTDQLIHYAQQICSSLTPAGDGDKIDPTEAGQPMTWNRTHGLLLQLAQIAKHASDDKMPQFFQDCQLLSSGLIERLVTRCPCSVVTAQYMSIINDAIKKKSLNLEDNRGSLEELERLLEFRLFSEDPDGGQPARIDVYKALFCKMCAEFLVLFHLSSNPAEPGKLLKLAIHPLYDVRLRSLEVLESSLLQKSGGSAPLEVSDLMNLILCEGSPLCLEMLLRCCALLPSTSYTGDQLSFLLSLIQTSTCQEVIVAGINLTGSIFASIKDLDTSTRLSWAIALKSMSSSEQSLATREAVAQALLLNGAALVEPASKNESDRVAFVLLWSVVLDIMFDDDEEVRQHTTSLVKILSSSTNKSSEQLVENNDSLEQLHSQLAVRWLSAYCVNQLGLIWPSALLLLFLGHITSFVLDSEADQATTEDDRAFDRGEMNIFQEAVTSCQILLVPLAKWMKKLSVGLQEAAFQRQLPSQLLENIISQLPGGISVYSAQQLLEYIKSRCESEPMSETEAVVFLLIMHTVDSPATHRIVHEFYACQKNEQQASHQLAKKSCSSYLLQSVLDGTVGRAADSEQISVS